MIIRKTEVNVVHIKKDSEMWTIVRPYNVFCEEKDVKYTAISEKDCDVQPYIMTAEGLEKMFGHDITSLFLN